MELGKKEWPRFTYEDTPVAPIEKEYTEQSGGFFALMQHLEREEKKSWVIASLSDEGVRSAEIEGEILRRESVQSSIKRAFGLKGEFTTKSNPKECGMAEMMWDLYETFDEELTLETLFRWHTLLMRGETHIEDRGCYRKGPEPMQTLSNRYGDRHVFFEAPPPAKLKKEVTRFIKWFNETKGSLAPLQRASVAHLYFEAIRPFENGNGRIGRALVEKALSQEKRYGWKQPLALHLGTS